MKRTKIVSLVLCIAYVLTIFAWKTTGDAVAKTVSTYLHSVSLQFDGTAPYGIPMHRGVSSIRYDTTEGTLRVQNTPGVGGSFYIGKDGTVGSTIVTQNGTDEEKAAARDGLFHCIPGNTYRIKFDYKFLAGTSGTGKAMELWLVPDPTAASISNYWLSARATLIDSDPAELVLGETATTLTEDTEWKTASYTFKINADQTEPLALGIRPGYSTTYVTAAAFDNITVDQVSSFEYDASSLHTMDDPEGSDAFIVGSGVTGASVVDGNAEHGKVLKVVAGANARLGFADFGVKRNRKYYIYYDAKSETANTTINTLIGVNGSGTLSCRYFFSGYENKNAGIEFYINGEQTEARNFKMSDSWARYGMIIDTSNEALLSAINSYSTEFWDSDIHFLFGASNATVYFDNIRLVEIEDVPSAVPDHNKGTPKFSIRTEKLPESEGETYRSAGLRFRATVDGETKSSADEIGFIAAPSSSTGFDPDWYRLENGKSDVAKSAVCYRRGDTDIVYSENADFTTYQLILSGLSSPGGKNAYDRRFSAVLYVKSGNTYTYYALGETSWYEVAAKYRVLNVDYELFDVVIDAELHVNGMTQHEGFAVGDPLPVLNSKRYDVIDADITFLGWYDSTYTTKYTVATKNVTDYYAKFSTTAFELSYGGMYDPQGRYNKPGNNGIAAWKYATDPTDLTNRCVKVDLTNNGQNTHFALSLFEGSSEGFMMKPGKKYVVSFRYYIEAETEMQSSLGFQLRGSAKENIGIAGSKTDYLRAKTFSVTGSWTDCAFTFTTDDKIVGKEYLIMLAQNVVDDVVFYMDDIYITELAAGTDVILRSYTDNVTYNENGRVSNAGHVYIGKPTAAAPAYAGAEFIAWYDSEFKVPYTRIPADSMELYAKYDATVLTFENGYLYDPNNKIGSIMSKFDIVTEPDNESNHVLRASLAGNGNNHNICLPLSGYTEGGYLLTTGSTYTVTFRYKGENVNSKGVAIQLRGSNRDGISNTGGKTSSLTRHTVRQTDNGTWKTATLTFTYTYSDTDYPYLLLLAQDNALQSDACTATVYFDDIVIKETAAAKTYTSNSISIGSQAIGTRKPNIVVPDYNFSYLAQMQIEELQTVIKNVTGGSCSRIHERSSTGGSEIVIGDVSYNVISKTSLTSEQYEIRFVGTNVYINGGSTYALAMGISEFAKMIETAPSNKNFTASDNVSGNYSEKIDGYGGDYYRPTLLEDFNGTEVNENIWTVYGKSNMLQGSSPGHNGKTSLRSPERTTVSDGKLIISAAYDDQYYYGGMLRSTGKMKYRYGYIESSSILPNGGGLWTAFWTTAPNPEGAYGSEVDINECFGNAGVIAANLHRWPTSVGTDLGYSHTSLDSGFSQQKRKYAETGKTFNDEFHTYGFYWTEEKCKFTCDGDVFFEYSINGDTVPANRDNDIDAFNEFCSLTMSMAVGFANNSDAPVEGADYWTTSNKLIVDYIHIYQIDGQDLVLG